MEHQTIVIGSGVAAAALTRRLLERNPDHSILMLEAGPRVPSKERRLLPPNNQSSPRRRSRSASSTWVLIQG